MNKTKKTYSSGVSMMEMVVYVAIIGIVLSIVVRLMAGTFKVFARTRSYQSLTSTGSSAMEHITTNIRNAASFSLSGNILGVNPSTLSIVIMDTNNLPHTYLYEVSNGRLTEKIDSGSTQFLTGPKQTINTFKVDQITAGTHYGAVTTIIVTDSRVSPNTTATFTTSTLMRGSY